MRSCIRGHYKENNNNQKPTCKILIIQSALSVIHCPENQLINLVTPYIVKLFKSTQKFDIYQLTAQLGSLKNENKSWEIIWTKYELFKMKSISQDKQYLIQNWKVDDTINIEDSRNLKMRYQKGIEVISKSGDIQDAMKQNCHQRYFHQLRTAKNIKPPSPEQINIELNRDPTGQARDFSIYHPIISARFVPHKHYSRLGQGTNQTAKYGKTSLKIISSITILSKAWDLEKTAKLLVTGSKNVFKL
eukprot:403343943